jgi:glycosyltransferase involved in cell wall biosynthesis
MPKVSVIIPTYNGKEHLGEAIQSVLDQTYQNFEVLVVNDASPDDTAGVMAQFDNPRIKYIVHERNRGVDQARSTGIRSSRGEIVAFLDQDDYFHPEKLEAHVKFLEVHPEVGFSYNARFELNYSAKTIRTIWRPSRNITLADLVLWFPIAPSDWVLRREWALMLVDLIEENQMWTGGEIVYLSNLLLSGCRFALVNRALNYRRHHSGRIIKDLSGGCRSEIAAQEKIFADPRCPADVLALWGVASANVYMFWAYRAFVQNETRLGQELIRKAVQCKPAILNGNPCELVQFLVINCSDDENVDYSTLLKSVFDQLPQEMSFLSAQYDWSLARGFLFKGTRAEIWDRPEEALRFFRRAKELGAEVDKSFLSHATKSLLDYELEFGSRPAHSRLRSVLALLREFADPESPRRLRGMFAMNRAFQSFNDGEFGKVPGRILQAMIVDRENLANRGLYAILFRSLFGPRSAGKGMDRIGAYNRHSAFEA